MFAIKPIFPAPKALQVASPQERLRLQGYMRVILVAFLVSAASIVLLRDPINRFVLTAAVPLALMLLWLVNQNHLNAPMYLLPVIPLLVTTVFSINGTGVPDPSFFASYLSILIAALLLGKRAVTIVGSIVLINIFVINALVRYAPQQHPTQLFYFALYTTLITLVVRNVVDHLTATILQVRANEHALEQANHQLEARVAERTAQLEEAMAQQVEINARLRELDHLKSQFLASMSHELRTPLNAILNFTEFVSMGMMGPVNDKQRDALEKSLDSGRHLLSLINDVLDITKIEAGMMTLFIETDVELMPEIESVLESARVLLKNKTVELIADVDAPLPRIIGDKRRIRQVLLNLLSNATKFTETGSITFSAKHQGDHLLFAILDTGVGIAEEDRDIIFEPFRQTEHGVSHAGGTGLGLPISKRLVEAHGGELWLESTPGEGSAFYVRVPIANPALSATLPLATQGEKTSV